MFKPLNVFGEPLEPCSMNPMTGYYRDGSCNSGIDNPAWHMVCIYATEEFLAYSKRVGNDLSTPLPQYGFEGIKAGDSWCLAAGNFIRAMKDGMAPKIFLHSTHQAILEYISLDTLKKYAIDLEEKGTDASS
ncbi:MAG: DUF2237 domain-containing protein [Epsilonproteobacteria bacterium]|nr:DUF2237 domain-containing protein [Campylobacterota bacterium]